MEYLITKGHETTNSFLDLALDNSDDIFLFLVDKKIIAFNNGE